MYGQTKKAKRGLINFFVIIYIKLITVGVFFDFSFHRNILREII